MQTENSFFLGYGQQAILYFSPHPPLRQKKLNACISDAFYRELFMSPCLSGWNDGEAKHNYMHLCHEVLSRSHLNAVVKLKDAGILLSNLAILPTISNTSLANNGTHVKLGSRKLFRLSQDPRSGFTRNHKNSSATLQSRFLSIFFLSLWGRTALPRIGSILGNFILKPCLAFFPMSLIIPT